MGPFIDCFRRNTDGSWTCVAATTLNQAGGPIRFTKGATFQPGFMFMGIRVTSLLDELAKYRRPPGVWGRTDAT